MANMTQQMKQMSQMMMQMMSFGMMGGMMSPATAMFASSRDVMPTKVINVKDYKAGKTTITSSGRALIRRIDDEGGPIEMEGVTGVQYTLLHNVYDSDGVNFEELAADNNWEDIPLAMKQDLWALGSSGYLNVAWRKVK